MPTWFDVVSGKPGVTGIKGFAQKVALREYKLYDVKAFCLGLCTHWLADKKSSFTSLKMFDEPKQESVSESTSLLSSAHRYTRISQEEQITYLKGGGGLNLATVLSTLSEAGLNYSGGESTRGESFKDDALTIGEHVSSVEAKYFMLIAVGSGAHAFGIVRGSGPGEFKTFRVFDPNAGEFEVTGQVGILAILVWFKTLIYPDSLGDSYDLMAFRG